MGWQLIDLEGHTKPGPRDEHQGEKISLPSGPGACV